ncbi:MAG: hypothetical protein R3B06_16460 [Kofleriaceae bacterium]
MPAVLRRAYTAAAVATVVTGAIAAEAMLAAHPSNSTAALGGLRVLALVDPDVGGVTVEAWLGGGVGPADAALAHLAEHVAVAQTGSARVDGRVTPEATIVRASAAELGLALGPVWQAMTMRHATSAVVTAEQLAIAREGAPVAAASARDVEAFWRRSWRHQRATLVVHGAFEPRALYAGVASWPGRQRSRAPARSGWRHGPHWAVPGPAATARGAPTAAVAAAAAGRIALVSGLFIGDGAVATPEPDDHDAWTRARLDAARLPVAGARGLVGELAAALHVADDLEWPARYRAAVARVAPAAALAWVRRLARQAPPVSRSRSRAAPAGVTRAAVERATTSAGGQVVVAADATAATVVVRWAWRGGPAAEGATERGLAVLAAQAITRCVDVAVVDAVGGRAEMIVDRDRIGLRLEVPAASWRAAVIAATRCLDAPDLSSAGHARDRARAVALATAVAGSPLRLAVAAFARHAYRADPLAAELTPVPVEASPAEVARWWRAAHPWASVVIAGTGPITAGALAAAASASDRSVGPGPAASAAPPPVTAAELYVDAPAGTALVLGFDALGAGDPDRAALDVLAAYLAEPGGPLAAAAAGAAALRVAVADTTARGYLAVAFDQPRDRAAVLAAARAGLAAVVATPPSAARVVQLRERLRTAPATTSADELAVATLVQAPPRAAALAAVDAAAVARVARRVLALDRAVVVTARPPDATPAVERRRTAPARRRRRAR